MQLIQNSKMTRMFKRCLFLAALPVAYTNGFVNVPTATKSHKNGRSEFFKSCSSKDSRFDSSSFDPDVLNERIMGLKIEIMEEELRRPPNAELSPKQLIEEVILGLRHPYDPLPEAGFRLMLNSATKSWRKKILQSVGANDVADVEIVVSALEKAITRTDNQYAILVGEDEDFIIEFNEPTDYEDGTCWAECRLRGRNSNELLVCMGWDLRQIDGAWMVHRIDWQDFREAYRPGIGREEWFREFL